MILNEDVESAAKVNIESYAWNLEKYSHTCGVRSYAMIRGMSALDAAIELSEIREPGGDWEYTNILTIGIALGRRVESAASNRDGEGFITFDDKFPTLAQWMVKNSKRIALLRADHHIAVVAYGNVLDKDWNNARAQVTQVIFLD